MEEVDKLLLGYQRFLVKYKNRHNPLFNSLQNQQNPKILLIGCCDSRVDPAILTDADPGDIFVIRNVANLVPPYEEKWDSKHGTSAAIEFAVKNLQVEHIIVLGHSNCGGIKSLVNGDNAHNISNQFSFIKGWIDIIRDIISYMPKDLSVEKQIKYCEHEGIKVSINNLISFPFIEEKINNNTLKVHGWYFNLEEISLYILDEDFREFKKYL
ncbi:Carbonic anhydrase [Candidatus Hepatincolaceae symbiont of Richtersius coronifer]